MLGMTDNTRVSSFINDTFEQPGYFFYAQDDLKVTTRLTLNLGIRYEFISHPTDGMMRRQAIT
jgi:outer membrane receptor protein involved in Fe transport